MSEPTTPETTITESSATVRRPRKKKHEEHGHHGGAWKVAYADFITTMMALFLLLWLLAVSDQSERSIVALYFRDPGYTKESTGARLRQGGGTRTEVNSSVITQLAGSGGNGVLKDSDRPELDELINFVRQRLKRSPSDESGSLYVTIEGRNDRLEIVLSDGIRTQVFQPGSLELTLEAKQLIAEVAEVIRAASGYRIALEGHTDRQPPGDSDYTQQDLTADRAQRVMQVLVAEGVPTERLAGITGFGDTRLLDEVNPFSPHNRRIAIVLLKDNASRVERPPSASGG